MHFTQATIFDPLFEPGSFDVILAFGILHLLKDLPGMLQRLHDLLKPGSWLISSTACMGQDDLPLQWINRLISVPARIGLLPTLKFLKIPELEDVITRAGFEVVETETIPFDPANGSNYVVGRFIVAQKPACC